MTTARKKKTGMTIEEMENNAKAADLRKAVRVLHQTCLDMELQRAADKAFANGLGDAEILESLRVVCARYGG